MKQPGLVAGGVSLAIVVVYLFASGERQDTSLTSEPFHNTSIEASAPQRATPVREVIDPEASGDAGQSQRPEREAELRQALEQLADAESALRASEREVEELEAMVEEIRARGENPADNFDLALERFQPAFFRFQDAAAAYEAAERRVTEARLALQASHEGTP